MFNDDLEDEEVEVVFDEERLNAWNKAKDELVRVWFELSDEEKAVLYEESAYGISVYLIQTLDESKTSVDDGSNLKYLVQQSSIDEFSD